MRHDRDADARLVAAAREGDGEAFERLVRGHIDDVYGHALRFFGEPQAAEDVTQEVFLKVFRTLDSFDGRSAFSTWLFRVTRNMCVDQFRAGRRRPVPVDPLDAVSGEAADFADEAALRTALERAVASLPPEDRDAFNAIGLFGLSYAEAADVLGAPVGTVKSRVFRARRTLVTILGLGSGGA